MAAEKNGYDEFRNSLSEIVTKALENKGDPSRLREIMEEQCREVCALPAELTEEATDVSPPDDEPGAPLEYTYTYVIGSMDDFDSMEDLISAFDDYKIGAPQRGNMGVYRFSLPYGTADEVALLMGKGMAFENDWSESHTFSFMQCEE